jgi:hypothetical protein
LAARRRRGTVVNNNAQHDPQSVGVEGAIALQARQSVVFRRRGSLLFDGFSPLRAIARLFPSIGSSTMYMNTAVLTMESGDTRPVSDEDVADLVAQAELLVAKFFFARTNLGAPGGGELEVEAGVTGHAETSDSEVDRKWLARVQ